MKILIQLFSDHAQLGKLSVKKNKNKKKRQKELVFSPGERLDIAIKDIRNNENVLQ